jgi:hypothetical protein
MRWGAGVERTIRIQTAPRRLTKPETKYFWVALTFNPSGCYS